MTRINVVPVDELTDNFIMAEYYELPRVFLLVHKHMMKGRDLADMHIPEFYMMGKGHVSFFYDKLLYLYMRHRRLYAEGTKRNLKLSVDPTTACIELVSFRHTPYWGDYVPTYAAIQLNRDRLQVRRRYEGGSYPAK